MSDYKTFIFSLNIIFLLTSCSVLHKDYHSDFNYSSLDFNSLGTYLDKVVPSMINDDLPGIQVALVDGGEIIYEKAFGLADKDASTPVTTSTIFQVASISKSVTAWAVLSLAEQKKIDLDSPISDYVHRWSLPPSKYNADGVTIRNILAHRAGLRLSGYPGYKPGERLPTIEESLSGDCGRFMGIFSPGSVKLVNNPGEKCFTNHGTLL